MKPEKKKRNREEERKEKEKERKREKKKEKLKTIFAKVIPLDLLYLLIPILRCFEKVMMFKR